ncbi:MAG TPA: aldehyde dehydrogenase family protein [Nitrospinota bacterium]|nr:aldehyde dehydrogenase family protein [Nitrospinota bacterium]
MSKEYKFLINGQWLTSSENHEIKSPYNGEVIGRTYRPSPDDVENAIKAATAAFEITKKMPPYERSEILFNIVRILQERKEELAQSIAAEAGKPIKAARIEAERSILTFTIAAEEAKRINGEIIPLDIHPYGKDRICNISRFPIGPIAGISPFNFPLNLVVHKVAPCIASGNTMLLKPASQTPLSSLKLGEIVMEAGLPAGALNILPCTAQGAEPLITDERIKKLTFTGSPVVGWGLKQRCGRKKITLELGGNAGVIVHNDADLNYAVDRVIMGGFGYSGQVCISVQRIFVHNEIFEEFKEKFIKKVKALKTGDPLDENTDVGPMISEKEADRVEAWIKEAANNGASILTGGERNKSMLAPTVITDVKPDMKVSCQELFAPVVTLASYSDFHAAVKEVNESEFGLQAGIFCKDLDLIYSAYNELNVGGLVIGDVPTFRIDNMPYGGVKSSGLGREGIRYAIEEMTELKALVLNLPS